MIKHIIVLLSFISLISCSSEEADIYPKNIKKECQTLLEKGYPESSVNLCIENHMGLHKAGEPSFANYTVKEYINIFIDKEERQTLSNDFFKSVCREATITSMVISKAKKNGKSKEEILDFIEEQKSTSTSNELVANVTYALSKKAVHEIYDNDRELMEVAKEIKEDCKSIYSSILGK